jgi:hypothetical protein
VTAREMGIPAAMSVRECLSRLTNGCRVRVDGSRGKIVLIDEAGEDAPPDHFLINPIAASAKRLPRVTYPSLV